ncbi:hypothetical protein SLEP1_g57699 [Rubroshorea leprosula]|uniref:Uncharacterized protein n=1 Tax=Rubroshorea leprosula TaxID=152421 RepID=A0AAV5MR11_9ROSI|nr:hypothetical protein SLEP1_g57699 [Rubroshorea leprosula]
MNRPIHSTLELCEVNLKDCVYDLILYVPCLQSSPKLI